jgi:hypothetical protein
MGFLDSLFRNNARSLSTVEKNLEAHALLCSLMR